MTGDWRAALEGWLDDGYSEVTRHSAGDGAVCEACRDLAEDGFNVFKIEHLLELENPLNEDPHTGKALCAGICRCRYEPRVGRKFLDDV